MSSQSRSTKVFMAALISIGVGAALLNVLGNNPPMAGAFSLSDYYDLAPVEEVVSSSITQFNHNWDSIDIGYSSTNTDDTGQEHPLSSLVNYELINYHFVVLNGLIGGDGQIESTWKWHEQIAIVLDHIYSGAERTIHLCVIADNKVVCPTDFQRKRTEELVESLFRRFDIPFESVSYPDDWW